MIRGSQGPLIVDGVEVQPCCASDCTILPGFIPATGEPNTNPTTTFVLACIDPRYATALEEYLNEKFDMGAETYDLFILAGASLGGNLTDASSCAIAALNPAWQQVLLDHVQVAITLHNVTNFVIVDHLDCGAFKVCQNLSVDNSPAPHEAKYQMLHDLIASYTFKANGTSTDISGSNVFTDISGYYFDTPAGNSSTTTLRNYSDVSQGDFTFPSTSGAKVLVLGCIDPRFTTLLSSFLINYKDVQFLYDLYITAGSSLGVNQSYLSDAFPAVRGDNPAGTDYPDNLLANNGAGIGKLGKKWGPTFFDHLAVAQQLHNITEVWVFDHLGCGAYKQIKFGDPMNTDMLVAPHTEELVKLRGFVQEVAPLLAFKGFVMDLDGNITKVVDYCA